MNYTLPFVNSTHTFSEPGPNLFSDYMLCELLAVHDDMITQLHIQRLAATDSSNLLTNMIEQHERDASQLLVLLETHQASFV